MCMIRVMRTGARNFMFERKRKTGLAPFVSPSFEIYVSRKQEDLGSCMRDVVSRFRRRLNVRVHSKDGSAAMQCSWEC